MATGRNINDVIDFLISHASKDDGRRLIETVAPLPRSESGDMVYREL